jgi:hypothetical protein
MAFTAEQQLQILQALTNTVATVPEAGVPIPTPLYCNDISEFWGTFDGDNKDTQEEIETTLIAATWIYPVQPIDDLTSSKPDSPEVNLTYELYQFRQYGLEREDENEMPDVFNKQILKQHSLFTKGWIDLKAEFQGNRNIDGLDYTNIFAKAQTTSLVFPERIQNLAVCDFVPGIVGFAVRMQETVKFKLREC